MLRNENIAFLEANPDLVWDLIVIGGGASGLATALEASIKGYDVLLIEAKDFAAGTSSKSTKLIHGGVRYLEQGNLSLVKEALIERGRIRDNAPHLFTKMAFVIPCYSIWQKWKYRIGLKIYDILSGRFNIGKSYWLSTYPTIMRLKNIVDNQLRGSVVYFDGQFEDARLAIDLAKNIQKNGQFVLNYMECEEFIHSNNKIIGIKARDKIQNKLFNLKAKAVVNATGVFSDQIRNLEGPSEEKFIQASRGSHLVIRKEHWKSKHALLVPKTKDGRILFCIPWGQHAIIGTTDIKDNNLTLNPAIEKEEIDFMINTMNDYLNEKIDKSHISAVFAGLRPLVNRKGNTKQFSRKHKIHLSNSQLCSVIGGKWTTYRKIGEDVVNTLIKAKLIEPKKGSSKHYALNDLVPHIFKESYKHLKCYGQDFIAMKVQMENDPSLAIPFHPKINLLPIEVVWALEKEMAICIDDILARRTKILFTEPEIAKIIAPQILDYISCYYPISPEEKTDQLKAFMHLADQFIINNE